LTKNGLKSIFFPKIETHTRSSVFFLLNLTIFDENKPFWIILEYFSSAHMCFSVNGHCGQNYKKVDLSLKINFFQVFRSRFGFLVQFYPYPELEINKYAQGTELLIFGVFLKNWPTVQRFLRLFSGTGTMTKCQSRHKSCTD
jgi:hypothetical protein